MRGSSFTFERIDLLEYHLHKISLNRGSSYIESPEWLKNKGGTINPKNTECNNKTIALNILYVPYNAKQVRQASTSECDNEDDN